MKIEKTTKISIAAAVAGIVFTAAMYKLNTKVGMAIGAAITAGGVAYGFKPVNQRVNAFASKAKPKVIAAKDAVGAKFSKIFCCCKKSDSGATATATANA